MPLTYSAQSASAFIAIVAAVGLALSMVAAIVFLRMTRTEKQGFSLSSASSEIVGYDTSGAPIYVSSSSRFIALFGFILLFWVYGGVGFTMLANGGQPPANLKGVEEFLFFGVALFAPYIANQVKAAFVGFGKGVPQGLPKPPPAAQDGQP